MTIDLSDGELLEPRSRISRAGYLSGITYDSNNGVMYGVSAVTDSLHTVNMPSGSTTLIGTFGHEPSSMQAIAYDPVSEVLYGTDRHSGLFYTIDRSTGVATKIGANRPIGGSINIALQGLAISPTTGEMYGSSSTYLYQVSKVDGKLTPLYHLGDGFDGLSFSDDGTLYGIRHSGRNLYRIDLDTGLGSFLGSFETFGLDQTTGFEIVTTYLGDFNYDQNVDGQDFLLWQRGKSTIPLSIMNLDDWMQNYGVSLQNKATLIPEPATLILGLVTLLQWIAYRRLRV